MSAPESWENICCRCGGDVKENVHPGRRACHITCGPCLYPDNPKCTSCEIIGHCRLALDYFKSIQNIEKGHYYNEQLTGDETLYHTLSFADSQQNLVKKLGEKQYMKELEKENLTGPVEPTRFVPGLPRNPGIGWTRITLHTPVSPEWVEAISKVYGVTAKLEGIKHVVVQGEQAAVKKAVHMLYELQMLYGMKETRMKNTSERQSQKRV